MAWVPALKARPTMYRGIQMRSRLEAGYAAWLDRHNFTWEYEPCAFTDRHGTQYLPDFRLTEVSVLGWDEPATAYVEVKPEGWDDYDTYTHLIDRMATIHQSDPTALVVIETPQDCDIPYAATLAGLWSDDSQYYCMTNAFWCSLRTGWARNDERLGLAIPEFRKFGPWFGEWWKGSAV